MGSYHITGT